jgi:hypothetical protein
MDRKLVLLSAPLLYFWSNGIGRIKNESGRPELCFLPLSVEESWVSQRRLPYEQAEVIVWRVVVDCIAISPWICMGARFECHHQWDGLGPIRRRGAWRRHDA